MQSLQLAVYWLCSTRDRRALQQKILGPEQFGKRQGATSEFGWLGRKQGVIFWREGIDPVRRYIFERSIGTEVLAYLRGIV